MQQKVFSRIDTLTGWLIFVIAAVIYCLTVEPTASLWDCPEFIACGYKLEIGHPPGAPFYMLVANLFSQMASDPSQVAWMINILSALLSAGCILFLFWTITHLARQLYGGHELLDLPKIVVIEACGVVGALVYTFSDSFWFSAVESEVYAFSSFLTALVFWLILRWEEEADHPQSDRWLILTAYIIGLSVGVHLLCLLCLPAMVLVVYGRKTKQLTWWSALKALLVGGVLLAMVLYMIIPGVLRLGSSFCQCLTPALPVRAYLCCHPSLCHDVSRPDESKEKSHQDFPSMSALFPGGTQFLRRHHHPFLGAATNG